MAEETVASITVIPNNFGCFQQSAAGGRSTGCSVSATADVFIIQALHPDGWRTQGSARVEYWAYQEAQARCCSDGRNYRIIHRDTNEIVALIDTSSCRLAQVVSR